MSRFVKLSEVIRNFQYNRSIVHLQSRTSLERVDEVYKLTCISLRILKYSEPNKNSARLFCLPPLAYISKNPIA